MSLTNVLAFLAIAIAVEAGDIKCPGSGSLVHAGTEGRWFADTICQHVTDEIKARVAGENGWTDPHNGGIYSLTAEFAPTLGKYQIETNRTTNPRTSFGGKVYTDKQIFTLVTNVFNNSECMIEACSASQGFSVKDFSTNYCDIHNLICGSDEGCKTVKNDFRIIEDSVKTNAGSGKDKSACIVKHRNATTNDILV